MEIGVLYLSDFLIILIISAKLSFNNVSLKMSGNSEGYFRLKAFLENTISFYIFRPKNKIFLGHMEFTNVLKDYKNLY